MLCGPMHLVLFKRPQWRFGRTLCLAIHQPSCQPPGDAVEARAIAQVFGGRPSLAVSSTKGAMGHLLGAAGAVEAAMAVLALYHGVAPPTLNLEDPEPAGLLPGLVGPTPLTLPPGAGAVLTNSFGFGGTNAALVFTRHAA